MADCLLLLSRTAQEVGDVPTAGRSLEQAEKHIQATANGFRAARALYQRATLLYQAGKADEA